MAQTIDPSLRRFGRKVGLAAQTGQTASPAVQRILEALRNDYPQSLFDQLRDRDGREVRREFVFYGGPDVTAFAARNRDTYVFGICEGLCDLLQGVAHTILSHPHVYADIGNTGRDADDTIRLPPLTARRTEEYPRPNQRRHLSKCPRRKLYADAMTSAMIYYVMHHEFLHVYYGHVDYFGCGKALPIILESTRRNDLATSLDIYRHISEIEADGGAWRSLFARHALPIFDSAYPELELGPPGWSRLFFGAMFVVTALWVLLDHGPELATDSWRDWTQYPAGIIRARALYRSPSVDATFVASLPDTARAVLREGFAQSEADLKHIAAAFGQFEFLGRLGSDSWDAPVMSYFDNVIAPHLARFHEMVGPFRPRPPNSP